MKVTVTKILVENPAAFILNKYRIAATNHINGALDTITANQGNAPAIMATVDQLYEDLQQLKMIGLLSDREYDAAAAIAFETIAGDNTHLSLPDITVVRNQEGDDLYEFEEGRKVVKDAIMTPVNKCLRFLVESTEEEWRNDGWETEQEYHQCILKTIHNIMRLGKIVGATTEKEHDMVTEYIKQCAETKTFQPVNL